MGEPHDGPYRVIRGERPDEMSKIVKESDPEYLIGYVIRDRNHLARANDDATADLLAASWAMKQAIGRLTVSVGEALALRNAGLNVPGKVWEEISHATLDAHQFVEDC